MFNLVGTWGLSRMSFIVTCVGLLLLALPSDVYAGPATGGASEWTQIANNLELAKLVGVEGETLSKTAQILSAEVQQVRTQIQTYQAILRNTEKLSQNFLNEAMGPIRDLQSISQQVEGVAKDGASLDAFLRSDAIRDPLFKKEPLNEARLSERYDDWQKQWAGTVETTLRGAYLTREDVETEASLIDTITNRFGNEVGHMQALQVANELSGSLARQMNQLRSLTATQAQQTSVAWGRVLSDMDAKEAGQRQFETQINQSLDNEQSQQGSYRSIHEILGIGK